MGEAAHWGKRSGASEETKDRAWDFHLEDANRNQNRHVGVLLCQRIQPFCSDPNDGQLPRSSPPYAMGLGPTRARPKSVFPR